LRSFSNQSRVKEACLYLTRDILKRCADICRKHNVLFIADEIQTGFGRTGKMFACDHENVRPDIITVGKALGGGVYPVSAMFSDNNVMDVFTPGDHGSTFGGNPLGAAVALACLEVSIEEKLADRSAELGSYFVKNLRDINSPFVKEVRGKGLMIGVEIKMESGVARPFCEELMSTGSALQGNPPAGNPFCSTPGYHKRRY
jgi:ornithine--oxo-acid transaminase